MEETEGGCLVWGFLTNIKISVDLKKIRPKNTQGKKKSKKRTKIKGELITEGGSNRRGNRFVLCIQILLSSGLISGIPLVINFYEVLISLLASTSLSALQQRLRFCTHLSQVIAQCDPPVKHFVTTNLSPFTE